MQRSSSLHLFLYTVFPDKDFLVLLLFKNKCKINQFGIYNSYRIMRLELSNYNC